MEVARRLSSLDADVVHIHAHDFRADLIEALSSQSSPPLVVSTPIFGRVPARLELLRQTRVCLVGVYTFYRFCRWLDVTAQQAAQRMGIGFVPITPFETPEQPISANDDMETLRRRRAEFGLPPEAFVIGRLGRDDLAKWHSSNQQLIPALLQADPAIHWLSIGYPAVLGLREFEQRWPTRFRNLPETADYSRLLNVLSSMEAQVMFGKGECFASSIAEAAGVGVPTIALATPLRDNGQAEQVIDGRTGYLVGSIGPAVARVKQMMADPAGLAQLKRQTQAHCLERWHADRAARDLVSLYEYWRAPASSMPEYARLMIAECEAFALEYHQRMIRVMGRHLLSRLKWRLLLKAVESQPVWKVGRMIKRLRGPNA